MQLTEGDAWVPLAEVARPHGVKGELRLRLFNPTSDVLLGQDEVLVRLKDGEEHEVSVERARRADDAILMKLFSVDDRDRAEELRGAHVCVRRRDFPEAEPGEFYAIDVVGSVVKLGGERIGVVAELVQYPSIEVLLIHADDGKGDWEAPLTEMFIGKVDVEGKVVELVTLDDVERQPRRKEKPKKKTDDAKASDEGSD
jgi:16S rRNA processing protein RimM